MAAAATWVLQHTDRSDHGRGIDVAALVQARVGEARHDGARGRYTGEQDSVKNSSSSQCWMEYFFYMAIEQ